MRTLIVAALCAGCARTPASGLTGDQWAPLRPFLGRFMGEGAGEPDRGARVPPASRRPVSAGKQSLDLCPPGQESQGEVHEHWDVFSWDRRRKAFVLRQFHTEGFVNQYLLETVADGGRTWSSPARPSRTARPAGAREKPIASSATTRSSRPSTWPSPAPSSSPTRRTASRDCADVRQSAAHWTRAWAKRISVGSRKLSEGIPARRVRTRRRNSSRCSGTSELSQGSAWLTRSSTNRPGSCWWSKRPVETRALANPASSRERSMESGESIEEGHGETAGAPKALVSAIQASTAGNRGSPYQELSPKAPRGRKMRRASASAPAGAGTEKKATAITAT